MIETTVLNYLNTQLDEPVYMSIPEGEEIPKEHVLIQKTGSSRTNHIAYATFALQSYGTSLYAAAVLNDKVKAAMDGLIVLHEISASRLNSDYNFTDTQTNRYRYQAVYDITYREE